MDLKSKRINNEKKFKLWKKKSHGRIYWREIEGKYGWKAKYIKEVDENENTVSFV